ncbi:tRNA dimethylallyltransferase isoform X2 [Amyelois transitella]|uniref:tRNA dimethylallyltransferase isoform X2 n=1 Tax=Amyelois transitella TaxID=680683 RepID=UPI0029904469|nr:tRNA dimethylallyltransferase isoform X2 [Amyelois transitella]
MEWRDQKEYSHLKHIYKGLDVVTAKASVQERELVKHHLMDILEPHQMFTVVDFRNRALKIIENLTELGKIPIIVGGTNYYIESIVYKILVEDTDDTEALLWDKSRRKRDFDSDDEDEIKKRRISPDSSSKIDPQSSEPQTDNQTVLEINDVNKSTHSKGSVKDVNVFKEKLKQDVDNEKNLSNEEIHEKLNSFDPVMAARLHPNNRRKVLRSIEVYLKTGRLHSEILAEQKLSEGELRRPGSTIIFWLKCEQSVHDQRLDNRVDQMLEEGLIRELLDFHDSHNKHRIKDGKPPDYTKGIFQTLGFKEFHDYLMMTEDQRQSEDGKKLLQLSIDNMKMATRRYARRQNKMVKGRFLQHPFRQVPPVYELDTTDISLWEENVKGKAEKIIESYLHESPCEYEPLNLKLDEEKKNIDGNSRNYCEVCNRLIIGDKTYKIHLKSNRHMKVIKLKKKLEREKPQETQ